jgi:hypothetical protein
MAKTSITFSVVGINIRIECDNQALGETLRRNFDAMADDADVCELEYYVRVAPDEGGVVVSRHDSDFRLVAKDTGELVYFLEGDLVVKLQLLRPDLLFLHSAVVSDGSSAYLFTGPSGAGKSTLCWGLLYHGFHYLSDELAPIDPDNLSVAPYLHALCLKSMPRSGFPMPDDAIVTERGWHIPPSSMPSSYSEAALPVKSIFFVEHRADAERATIERVENAEAATRLYPNILNALAHDNDGLDAALLLTRDAHCYRVESADLTESCALIKGVVVEIS